MRKIAEEAGVAQALLHYHFKTKDKLYEAIFERRATVVNGHRERLLSALFNSGRKPTLIDVLDVMFSEEASALVRNPKHGNAFQQLVTATSVSDDERSRSTMLRHYDPIALKFIDALQKVEPGLTHDDAVWAYLFALGARMQATARNSRAQRLAGREDAAPAFARIKAFVAAGVRDLAGTAGGSDIGTPSVSAVKLRRAAAATVPHATKARNK
jgi:AcrR family transcriptional regulator